MSLEFLNFSNLNDIWLSEKINYQTLQDLKTFLETR